MKRLHHIFLAFILVAASCTPHGAVEDGNKVIQATLPDYIESKVALTEKSETSGLALSWKQSDRLLVAGETLETYTLKAIDGMTAKFAGKEEKCNVFDVILSNSEDYENRWYLSQRQTGVDAMDHLEYDACLKGVDTYTNVKFTQDWAAEHGGELLQCGWLLLSLQLPVGVTKVTQVRLEASSPVFYATNSESSSKHSV